eukprot:scaffold100838_cov38-Prasinocladus_malaysianus.AAC.1
MAMAASTSFACVRADAGVLSARRSSSLAGSFGRLSLARPQTTLVAGRSSVAVSAGRIGPGKPWEKIALTKNGKPEKVKMHVKTGDKVVVIAGKDKGKVSEITKVYTKTGAIIVKDCNIKTVHKKPQVAGETGSIIQAEAPMHHSNVMHWSSTQNCRSRVGKKIGDDGKKVRYLVKTGEVPSGEKLERSIDGHVHELEAKPTTADLSLAMCSVVTFHAFDSLPESPNLPNNHELDASIFRDKYDTTVRVKLSTLNSSGSVHQG